MARDRAPSFQFYPRDFMADPAVQAMTWDQRGRYVWALSCSWLTDAPGVATEDQWREWMRFTKRQWEGQRERFAACFDTDGNVWTQKRLKQSREEQREYLTAAKLGGVARAERMTREERAESARRAASARWGTQEDAC